MMHLFSPKHATLRRWPAPTLFSRKALSILLAVLTLSTANTAFAGDTITLDYGNAALRITVSKDEFLEFEEGASTKHASGLEALPPLPGAPGLRRWKRSPGTKQAPSPTWLVLAAEGGREIAAAGWLGITNRISLRLRPGIDAAAFCTAQGLLAPRALGSWSGTWVAEVPDGPSAALDAVARLKARLEVLAAAPVLARPKSFRLIPNDTRWDRQWNLRNDGTRLGTVAGNDINIAPAWDLYTGAGINIGIVDNGVEYTHKDLAGNIALEFNVDFWDDDLDPAPTEGFTHGTEVAGVAGAVCNNNEGICGAAFGARLAVIRALYSVDEDDVTARALSYTIDAADPAAQVHIFNNSYGPDDDGQTLEGPGPLTLEALDAGTRLGRNGRGAIYIWAAGNGRAALDDANYDGFASDIHVITVGSTDGAGAIAPYSEGGASVMLNAPSGYDGNGIASTKVFDQYQLDVQGTSVSAPQVAGIVAMMLEANPALGWRDVQHMLINSAQWNAPADPSWITNTAGWHYSRDFGFGRADALAAVTLAETWTNVPTWSAPLAAASEVNAPVPDNDPAGIEDSLTIEAPSSFFTERVIVRVTAEHTFRGDLEWTLRSPRGTEILLAGKRPDGGTAFLDWPFESLASWGEDPAGAWTLRVADAGAQDTGTLVRWSIAVYGYVARAPHAAHTADRDQDGALSLSELLRLVQFYNLGGVHCEANSEDGYAPGPGDPACVVHDSDYAPQDGQINLTELLRAIQLYNAGSYAPCAEGEDGFCPAAG